MVTEQFLAFLQMDSVDSNVQHPLLTGLTEQSDDEQKQGLKSLIGDFNKSLWLWKSGLSRANQQTNNSSTAIRIHSKTKWRACFAKPSSCCQL
ncbi:hypothetical protein DPMN_049372 [Dreissena polymorpha]|nr:hypothetical protein DPMN_049372 [Dreissena polymorpha]